MKKIKVPEGMLEAAMRASMEAGLGIGPSTELVIPIEAALLWLTEHPIVPADEQLDSLLYDFGLQDHENAKPYSKAQARCLVVGWQRRMFLAPEPEVPEAIKDLMDQYCSESYRGDLLEAYHRGLRSKEKP